jgi:hypothetical protein
MEYYYIVLLCLGALFITLVICNLIYACKSHRFNKAKKAEMYRMYADKNIKKIEYDLAFYDKIPTGIFNGQKLSEEEKVEFAKETERAIFNKIQSERTERVIGQYEM